MFSPSIALSSFLLLLLLLFCSAKRLGFPQILLGVPSLAEKKVVGGSSNKPLANEIAEELGLKCGKVTLGRYADGEVMVRVDEHVRGKGKI